MNDFKISVEPADNGFTVRVVEYNPAIHHDDTDVEIKVFQDREEFRKWLGSRVNEWTGKFSYRSREIKLEDQT